jgi:hypothetical protein
MNNDAYDDYRDLLDAGRPMEAAAVALRAAWRSAGVYVEWCWAQRAADAVPVLEQAMGDGEHPDLTAMDRLLDSLRQSPSHDPQQP